MKRLSLLLAGAALAVSAQASPITSPPSGIIALGGNVTAVYVYADAMDSSVLGLTTPPPLNPIFCNNATITCVTPGTAGNTVDLGARNGLLTFTLENTSTGLAYDSTNADADGNYHARITTNYADFGVGDLPSAAADVLAGLPNVTFVGFEDRQLINSSDWDYNDLIFAFSNTAALPPVPPAYNSGVPEPLTLGLMAAGLLGVFGTRRKN
jgi:hypothetical protein